MKRQVCVALVAAALASCSSGGGGSGGPTSQPSPPPGDSGSPPASTPPESSPPESNQRQSSPPESGPPAPPFEYRTLATVSGDVRVSSAVPTINYGALRDRITASADGAGNVTFRVNDPMRGPYTFTVNVPPNTSFTINTGTEEVVLTSLTYSAAGVWGRPDIMSSFPSGAAAFGVATRAADLPRTGTASYSGAFIGIANSDFANFGVVNASASSLANFGTGQVSFETTNSRLNWGTGFEPSPYLDLSGSMTFQSSGGVRQNALRGPVATKPGGWNLTGEVRGNFYGPASSTSPPPELSGSVAVGRADSPNSPNGGEGRALIGGFVMKR